MVHRKYIFRRGLAIFLSMAMVVSLMTPWTALAEGEDIQFYTTSTCEEVHPGDKITVEVRMSTQKAIKSGTIALYYDTSKLTYVKNESKLEPAFNPLGYTTILQNTKNTALITTALVTNSTPFPTGNDLLVETLTFTVNSGVTGDIDFRIDPNAGKFQDSDKTPLTVGTEDRTKITSSVTTNPATSITVSPKELPMVKGGEAQQLTATPKAENGQPTSDKVVWSSENDDIATVDQDGWVTPVGGGTTTIKATAGEGEGRPSDTCVVTVESPLEDIYLKPAPGSSNSISKGETTTLTVSYDPTDTTVEKNVSWSVTNDETTEGEAPVAEFVQPPEGSSTATIKGLRAGTATVTASLGEKTASCEVTVTEIPLDSIQVSPTSASIAVGGQTTLGVTYNPSNTTDDKTVTWTSSDEDVATVDRNNGTVTGVSPGDATITATDVRGHTVTSQIEVTKKKIIVSWPTEADLTYGQTLGEAKFVGGSATDSDGNTVAGTFAFSPEAQQVVPSVSNSGSYKVTFTPADSNYESDDTGYVKLEVAKKAVTVKADNKEMTYKGAVPEFTFTVPDGALVGEDTKDMLGLTLAAYESEGVEVSSNTHPGTYDIIEKDCESANYDVTVTPGRLTIDKLPPVCTFPTSAKVTTGQPLAQAVFVDESGEGTFAFVDADHVVTIDDIGKSYNVIFTPNNTNDYETMTQSVPLDVTVPLESISINPPTALLKPDETRQLSVVYYPEQTTVNKSVTWDSDNKDVATVDDSGLVTAKTEGTARITATVAGCEPAECLVTVKDATVNNVTITGEDGVMQGLSAQYTATVTGTNLPNTDVTWKIEGNSSGGTVISEDDGVLTIGKDEAAPTIKVIATSVVDSDKYAEKTVTIYKRGDFTHNGRVDTLDKKYLLEAMNNSSSLDENSMAFKEFDLDQNGKLNQDDLDIFLSILALVD